MLVHPLCKKMHSYVLRCGPLMATFYIFMLKPCVYIYNTYTLCGVPLVPKITFPDFRMPPKKRNLQDISHEPKGVGRLYLEEHWSFIDEELTNYFILTHGHIWFHLITHQFDVGNLTLILSLHTNDLLHIVQFWSCHENCRGSDII